MDARKNYNYVNKDDIEEQYQHNEDTDVLPAILKAASIKLAELNAAYDEDEMTLGENVLNNDKVHVGLGNYNKNIVEGDLDEVHKLYNHFVQKKNTERRKVKATRKAVVQKNEYKKHAEMADRFMIENMFNSTKSFEEFFGALVVWRMDGRKINVANDAELVTYVYDVVYNTAKPFWDRGRMTHTSVADSLEVDLMYSIISTLGINVDAQFTVDLMCHYDMEETYKDRYELDVFTVYRVDKDIRIRVNKWTLFDD